MCQFCEACQKVLSIDLFKETTIEPKPRVSLLGAKVQIILMDESHYLFLRFTHMFLFCICSQELLEAVERERNFRFNPSRNATIFHHPTLGDFELQHVCSLLILVWKHFVLLSCMV